MLESIRARIKLSKGSAGGVRVDWTLGSKGAWHQLSYTDVLALREKFRNYVTTGHMEKEAARMAGLDLWNRVFDDAEGFDKLVGGRREGQRSVIEVCDGAAPGTQDLPWELLFLQRSAAAEQGLEEFALQEPSVDLIRVIDSDEALPEPPRPEGERLRIVIVTGPQDVGGIDGGKDNTFETIVDVFDAGLAPNVEIVGHLKQLRLAELMRALEDRSKESPIDLLVFRGHGTATGLALFEPGANESPWTPAGDITTALRERVRVAVLLACRAAGATSTFDDVPNQENVARSLAGQGIHTVAFQTDVGANSANLFLRKLSESLVKGQTIPEAVEVARRAFAHYSGGQLDFASPTLWQPTPTALRLMAAPREGPSLNPAESRKPAALVLATPSGEDRIFVWDDGFRVGSLSARGSGQGPLVAPDGRVVARWNEEHQRLSFAWVSRGQAWPWRLGTTVSTRLPSGRVLAISRAGSDGVLVLQSSAAAVTLWLAQPEAEALCVAERPGSAELGVLRGAKALLLKQVGDEVNAFPGLAIEVLQAAASGGVTAVLARGRLSDGRPAAWVSAGTTPLEVPYTEASLVLPLSDRERPRVRGAVDAQDRLGLDGGGSTGFGFWSHDFSTAGGPGPSRRALIQPGDR